MLKLQMTNLFATPRPGGPMPFDHRPRPQPQPPKI